MKRVLIVLVLVTTAVLVGPDASAGCHSFTVGATSSVMEGGKVDVLIERDGAVNPSSVRVQSVNGTAKAPGDFPAFDQRVEFTNETSKTVSFQTKQDTAVEGNEAFQIKVSEAEGCAVNPNFVYGDPALVTIKDDDNAPTTAPTTQPTATPSPSASASPTPTASTTPTPTASTSPSPLPTISAFPVTEEEGGSTLPIVLGIVGLLAASGGGLLLYRMRRSGGI